MRFLEIKVRILEVTKDHPDSEWENLKSDYDNDFEQFAKSEIEEMDLPNSAELIFQEFSCTKIEHYEPVMRIGPLSREFFP